MLTEELQSMLKELYISEYEDEEGNWLPDVDIDEHNAMLSKIIKLLEGGENFG